MKPTIKQLDDLKAKIVEARAAKMLTNTELGRMSCVHPSQVAHICEGGFKTFSHNIMQVCKPLDVTVPRLEPQQAGMAPEWAQAMSRMRRIWDDTPKAHRSSSEFSTRSLTCGRARIEEALRGAMGLVDRNRISGVLVRRPCPSRLKGVGSYPARGSQRTARVEARLTSRSVRASRSGPRI